MTYLYKYGTKIKIPIYFWYIEGADKNILVDTGADAKMATSFRSLPAEHVQTFEQALASIGLRPEDIDLIIQTHLHWDHCGNTTKCKNARVIIQDAELKFALAPHPVAYQVYKKDLYLNLNFIIANGNYEVAPGIDLVLAPGHSPGSQAVVVNTEKGRAVISGFCCLPENYNPPDDIKAYSPIIASGIHTDLMASYESLLRVKGLADILICQHDPAYESVKSIP